MSGGGGGCFHQGAVRPPPAAAARQAEEAKRREQDQANRQAELKVKREQEEQRRKEQAAALAVRKSIQKVRTATPDNYDDLRAQLEEAQVSNLEAMGSQAEKVSQEAAVALEQAQTRIDEVNVKAVEDEKRFLEQEQVRKEQETKIEAFVTEAKAKATCMLDKVKAAEEQAEKLSEATTGATPDSMVKEAETAEKNVEETMQAAKNTRLDIIEQQKDFADVDAFRKVKREILELTSKLASGVRSLDKFGTVIKTTRESAAKKALLDAESAAKKATALQKLEDRKQEFYKYDKDKDGKLSRKEVESYCKAVTDFQLAKDVLDTIMEALEPITAEKLRPLHRKVWIAKSEDLARKQRAEEEARRKVLEDQRAAVQSILDEAASLQTAADLSATEAEQKARPLISRDTALSAEEIQEAASEAEKLLQKAEAELSEVTAKLSKATEDCDAKEDLKGFEHEDKSRIEHLGDRTRGRLNKVTAAIKLAREKALRKAFAETDKKRAECVTAIRQKMTDESKSGEQCFEAINEGNALTKEQFATFLKSLSSLELQEGDVDKLFGSIAGDEGSIIKERFMEMVRMFYKCVKATVMSEEKSIKSKTVRRLELGEVLEVLEPATTEEASGVQRVRCQAVQDEATGWVTLAGNQGTAFLEPGGNFYSCVKETLLTDGLSVQESKTIRRITKGEVLEVLEFPKKDASADVQRIKGKAKSDGIVGWITVSSNTGTAFLEPC